MTFILVGFVCLVSGFVAGTVLTELSWREKMREVERLLMESDPDCGC